MKTLSDNRELIERYLLGEASEQERLKIEEKFFADDECFEQMLAGEDELFYDYASGRLGGPERSRFEKRFLSSEEGRRKVETARAVMGKLALHATTTLPAVASAAKTTSRWPFAGIFNLQNRAIKFALAGAALLAVVGFIWLMLETTRLRNRVVELQAEQAAQEQQMRERAERERARADQLSSELDRERINRAQLEQQLADQQASRGSTDESVVAPAIVSMVLTPGLVRGDPSEVKRLIIPNGTSLVRIQLEIKRPADYRSYRVGLLTAEGRKVWSRAGIAADTASPQRSITVIIPARAIAEGDYEITLAGLTADKNNEDIASYYFTAFRK